ncbi:MAG: translation initiation factor eIF-2B [Candidatus Aenigmarchaeota archaeon]|nr:translation initiation factor eIF-2B [Candidatus Aenigmarchaeota archaeon]
MGNFERICSDIKSVKIQGAENVAIAGIKALMIKSDAASIKKLLSLRPTEPALRNAVRFARKDPKNLGPIALKHFEVSKKKLADYGAEKIEDGMNVFTHCHSSSVVAILKKAKEQGKKFEVYNTETRPLFQGRKTAKELSSMGIRVTHVVDSAARIALKDCDMFLFGADAITSEGKVVNKIGTEMFAEVAEKYDTDVYSCTDSWKYDPQTVFGKKEPIEIRDAGEVWPAAPKGVRVLNLAFERVKPELITAVISELGVHPPTVFVQEVRRVYPWIE